MSTPLPDTQPAAIAPQPLERFTVQQCPVGVHADWAADTENAHACPWCEIDRLRTLAKPQAARYRDRHGDIWMDRPGGDVQLVRTVAMTADCDNGWREQRESVERDFGPLVPAASLPAAEDGE